MTWKNRKRKKKVTKFESYSIINKFKTEKKITNSTLNDINNISLEDLVAIKLELSTRYLCGKFYGMPLWRITRHTVTDALLKTALSIRTCRGRTRATEDQCRIMSAVRLL